MSMSIDPIRGGVAEVNGSGRLVVFDLDGTLIYSRRDLAESANQMLASYGAPPLPDEAVAGMVGDGARMLVERALAAAGRSPKEPDALYRFLAIYDRELLATTSPYPGVVQAVADIARRAPVAVLTNKPAGPTARLLEAFGLASAVRWAIAGDSGHPRKPDAAGLRWLMAAAGAQPGRTVFVGDSVVDMETARRAGSGFCFAGYGFGTARGRVALRPGDLEVLDPADLLAVLTRFLDRETTT
jgi:phosphoglycolate phosphatase